MMTFIVERGQGDELWVNAGSHAEAARAALAISGDAPGGRFAVMGPNDPTPQVVDVAAGQSAGDD